MILQVLVFEDYKIACQIFEEVISEGYKKEKQRAVDAKLPIKLKNEFLISVKINLLGQTEPS